MSSGGRKPPKKGGNNNRQYHNDGNKARNAADTVLPIIRFTGENLEAFKTAAAARFGAVYAPYGRLIIDEASKLVVAPTKGIGPEADMIFRQEYKLYLREKLEEKRIVQPCMQR